MKATQQEYPEFKLDQQPVGRPSKTPQSQLSEEQHEKITNLCNVYGLNGEETRQLIEQLKAGGNISIEQSNLALQPRKQSNRRQPSIVSIKNEEMSFNDSQFRFDEEYSFKQHHQRRISMSSNGEPSNQHFEKLLMNKLKHEEDYIDRLRTQNDILKSQKVELANKLTMLMRMKEQETDIMLGLKNTICSLTGLLSDKETAYTQLQNNYSKLIEKLQNKKINCVSEKQNWQMSQSQVQAKLSTTRMQKKESRENILTEVSLKESNIERKPSKEFAKNKSTTNFHASSTTGGTNCKSSISTNMPPNNSSQMTSQQNQLYVENIRQQEKQDSNKQQSFSKKQRIDISKYKVFIDELRNICINKQK